MEEVKKYVFSWFVGFVYINFTVCFKHLLRDNVCTCSFLYIHILFN